ncbi:hypothetical protein KSS87_001939 [Heliosperma pusillum]|nr:hypothetical protein KSS87_001939 [Heliosperma pusillum]
MERDQNNSKVMTAYPPLPSYTYPQHQPLFGDTVSANNFVVRPVVLHETNYRANNNVPCGYPRVSAPNQVVPHHNTISQYYYHNKLQDGSDCIANGDNLEREDDNDDNNSSIIDPKIVNLLEPFRQLFSEHEGTLKTIFPGLYSKLSEFFKKPWLDKLLKAPNLMLASMILILNWSWVFTADCRLGVHVDCKLNTEVTVTRQVDGSLPALRAMDYAIFWM